MKVFRYPHHLHIKKSSLIMGAFEVIHNGHVKLIKTAQQYNDKIVMMIFEDPSLLPKSTTKNATGLDVRLEQLANLDVDYVIIVSMNEKIKGTEGYDFVKTMVKIAAAKRIIVGKYFKTGLNAKYDIKTMKQDFNNVLIVDLVKAANTKISSSLIKELLELGDVEAVKKICPFPFQMRLNFNAKKITYDLKKYANIHAGIYASFCEFNDIIYWSLFHIDMNHNKGYIFVPDFNIVNNSFNAKIWFHKKIRTIIKSDNDYITKNDKEMIAKYLINL